MSRIALFPGTFDPPTNGHLDVIEQAKLVCDQLIIAVAHNPTKKALFSIEERIDMLKKIAPNAEIVSFHGLIADLAHQKKATFLIRGLRTFSDFERELQMAQANRRLGAIETLFVMGKHLHISSSLIREILHFKGSLREFVPAEIESLIVKKWM